ncbi:MAG: hypothetical protein V4717_18500 [Bacteroidota bacterium]
MNSIPFNFDEMTKVQWMGITILEPVTVITNLLITTVCLFAFLKIHRIPKATQIQLLFKYFFLFMALATATGGILGHGFLYITGIYGKLPGWYISMFAIAFIERAAIIHSRPLMPAYWGKFFSILNYVEVVTFLILVYKTLNFHFVELHATYGLFIVVFSFELYTYIKTKDRGARYIFGATLLAAVAAISNLLKISPHRWFNYNDVSHVIMVGSIYLYYLGCMHLKMYEDQPERKVPVLQ